jgi:hypothetical protein
VRGLHTILTNLTKRDEREEINELINRTHASAQKFYMMNDDCKQDWKIYYIKGLTFRGDLILWVKMTMYTNLECLCCWLIVRNCLHNLRGFDFYVAPFAAAGCISDNRHTFCIGCVFFSTNEFLSTQHLSFPFVTHLTPVNYVKRCQFYEWKGRLAIYI